MIQSRPVALAVAVVESLRLRSTRGGRALLCIGRSRRAGVTVLAGLALMMLAIGCGDDEAAGPNTTSRAGTSGDTATGPAKIDGKFDVGGHSLYLKCRGAARPTIVYMHGSITEANVVPHTNGTAS